MPEAHTLTRHEARVARLEAVEDNAYLRWDAGEISDLHYDTLIESIAARMRKLIDARQAGWVNP